MEFTSKADMIQVESPNMDIKPNCVENNLTDLDYNLEPRPSPEISERGIVSPGLSGVTLALAAIRGEILNWIVWAWPFYQRSLMLE